MSAALYVGLACAALGVLFWIAALVLFPLNAPQVIAPSEDDEPYPYGEANTYRRER
ncbi:hypothetical protein Pam5_45 [Pseudanabaena phage Pam5]|nr:hypothetical protein Pam5_45 [Pseudanabaena phage Pam5]